MKLLHHSVPPTLPFARGEVKPLMASRTIPETERAARETVLVFSILFSLSFAFLPLSSLQSLGAVVKLGGVEGQGQNLGDGH